MIGGALEFMLMLLAAAYLLSSVQTKTTDAQNLTNGSQAAWIQRVVTAGAKGYIQNNYQTVYNAAASGPITIPLSTLQGQGYLPASFTATNFWGQTPVIVIEQNGANGLYGIVATSGGSPIPVQYLSAIARMTADYGAYVPYASEPNTCSPAPCAKIVGGAGGFALSPFAALGGSPGQGHLVNGLVFTAGQETAPYLYRLPNGNQEDQTMHQDILVNGNNVTGANKMTATIFADSANPATYYVEPATTSNLNNLNLAGTLNVQNTVTAKAYLYTP